MFCLFYYLSTAPKEFIGNIKTACDSVMVISIQNGVYIQVYVLYIGIFIGC